MTRLFEDSEIPLAEGAVVLREFAQGEELLPLIEGIVAAAPLRHLVTPGGYTMSVAMTNCGRLGWTSDRKGYRYSPVDPETGLAWPAMPGAFLQLARMAAERAGFPGFVPEACLINRYAIGAKLTLHQDRDEDNYDHPIVSVSLGVPAVFQFGGTKRTDPLKRVTLYHGDVVVWGGPARLAYHGIQPLKEATHPVVGACRLNLTFRKAG